MRSWIKEKHREYCKPKPEFFFHVIDKEKEELPAEIQTKDIYVYFIT